MSAPSHRNALLWHSEVVLYANRAGPHPPELINITRVAYPPKVLGWNVRFLRATTWHRKLFSDGVAGGWSGSLRRAMHFRDELASYLPSRAPWPGGPKKRP
jgi:hypothetical protein